MYRGYNNTNKIVYTDELKNNLLYNLFNSIYLQSFPNKDNLWDYTMPIFVAFIHLN